MADRIPSYRRHKPTGQAVVTLNGRDHYLGLHGTAASRRAYDRLISRWTAAGRRLDDNPDLPTTVDEMIDAWLPWARRHYRKAGRPTSAFARVLRVAGDLHRMHGDCPAAEFGPSRLRQLRQAWVYRRLSRGTCNQQTADARGIFRWGVEHEMVPGSVLHALQAVRGLAAGRTDAPDRPMVLPAPEADVAAAVAAAAPHISALIRLQLATGMRPGEVAIVRAGDVDRSRLPWVYTPRRHKTEHRGRSRPIVLGPAARAILGPLLDAIGDPEEPLFRSTRGAPMDEDAYYRGICRACDEAGVPRFSPNRLRHNFATRARAAGGVEAARVLLGHASAVTSEIYAEKDMEQAAELIEEIG